MSPSSLPDPTWQCQESCTSGVAHLFHQMVRVAPASVSGQQGVKGADSAATLALSLLPREGRQDSP